MATEAEMCTYRWAAGPGKPNTRSDDVYIDEKEFKDITKHRPRLACPECGNHPDVRQGGRIDRRGAAMADVGYGDGSGYGYGYGSGYGSGYWYGSGDG